MMPEPTNNSSRKILIVDDDHDLCANLKDILGVHGFSVTCAFDGQQAVQKVIEEPPAIVLMDVQMPVMNGLTALKKIKQLTPLTPVWLMTGYTNLYLGDDATRVGAAGVLAKPLDIARILQVISA